MADVDLVRVIVLEIVHQRRRFVEQAVNLQADGLGKVRGHRVLQHGLHRVVIAQRVEHGEGRVVPPELLERQHLEKFLVCPDAAGGHNKGVGPLHHEGLAFGHRLGVDELAAPVKEYAGCTFEKRRRDPDKGPAAVDHAARCRAHHALRPAAIDHRMAARGNAAAKVIGRVQITRVQLRARRAVKADIHVRSSSSRIRLPISQTSR